MPCEGDVRGERAGIDGQTACLRVGRKGAVQRTQQRIGQRMKSKNEEIKKRLIPEIYKIYGMDNELKALKEKLTNESSDKEYIKWLNNI